MKMKKLLLLALVLGLSTLALAENWHNVVLIDSNCAMKPTIAKNPDMHTRACAILCAESGYGIITSDGKFLKFDKNGNEKALALLKASNKNDHLRVNVKGDLNGDTIAVKTIAFK